MFVVRPRLTMLAVVLALMVSVPVFAIPVTIDFDALPAGTSVSTQFAASGILFAPQPPFTLNPEISLFVGSGIHPVSGLNHLSFPAASPLGGGNGVMLVTFVGPDGVTLRSASRIGAVFVDAEQVGGAALAAFGPTGGLPIESVTLPPSTNGAIQVGSTSAGTFGIASAVITLGNSPASPGPDDAVVLDNLTFEVPEPTIAISLDSPTYVPGETPVITVDLSREAGAVGTAAALLHVWMDPPVGPNVDIIGPIEIPGGIPNSPDPPPVIIPSPPSPTIPPFTPPSGPFVLHADLLDITTGNPVISASSASFSVVAATAPFRVIRRSR